MAFEKGEVYAGLIYNIYHNVVESKGQKNTLLKKRSLTAQFDAQASWAMEGHLEVDTRDPSAGCANRGLAD
ncbi:MAG: hypothetical protein R3297_10590, partial [Desulfobulbales bacterium]|nr:hypothetical protein [Desulfobulbales bacterium]